MHSHSQKFLIAIAVVIGLTNCSAKAPSASAPTAQSSNTSSSAKSAIRSAPLSASIGTAVAKTPANDAWRVGYNTLQDAEDSAVGLTQAVSKFLKNPTTENHSAAQKAWLRIMRETERLSLLRYIKQPENPAVEEMIAIYRRLTSWPAEPGFLDGFGQHPTSGIVFDLSVPLTTEELHHQHQRTAPSEVSLGLYALGVMLFGEHNARNPEEFEAIDTLTDALRKNGYQSPEELPNNRRRRLLGLQYVQLVNDLRDFDRRYHANTSDSTASYLTTLSIDQQIELLNRAAMAMLVDQMVAIGKHQSTVEDGVKENNSWEDYVLIRRVHAQLTGWFQFVTPYPQWQGESFNSVREAIQQALSTLNTLLENTLLENDAAVGDGEPSVEADLTAGLSGTPAVSAEQWRTIYQELRQLSRTLGELKTLPAESNKPQ